MSKSKNTVLVVFDSDKHKLVANEDVLKNRMQPIQDEINAARKSMNPALIEEADELRKSIDTLFARGFQRAWKMGERLKRVDTDIETFEAGAVPKIAAYLHYSKEALYKWIRFHEDYTEDEVILLAGLRMKLAGSPLSWKHVDEANCLEDQKMRLQFLNLAAKHDLTPAEMAESIQNQFGAGSGKRTSRHAGGRPVKVPSTYSARLENLDKFCIQIIRNSKDMWQHSKYGFLQTIDEVPADKLPKLISTMDKELMKVDAAVKKLNEVQQELQKARATAADRIDEQSHSTGSAEGKAAGKKGGKNKKVNNPGSDVVIDQEPSFADAMKSMGDD